MKEQYVGQLPCCRGVVQSRIICTDTYLVDILITLSSKGDVGIKSWGNQRCQKSPPLRRLGHQSQRSWKSHHPQRCSSHQHWRSCSQIPQRYCSRSHQGANNNPHLIITHEDGGEVSWCYVPRSRWQSPHNNWGAPNGCPQVWSFLKSLLWLSLLGATLFWTTAWNYLAKIFMSTGCPQAWTFLKSLLRLSLLGATLFWIAA